MISPCRIAAKNRSGSSGSISLKAATVFDLKTGNFNFGKSKSVMRNRSVRSSGAGNENTLDGFISNSSHNLVRSF